jgi:hypothetical protein
MSIRSRLPVLCLVGSVLAALLVIYEGGCLAATLFRGYHLAACVSHNGLLLIVLGVLFAPLAFLVDCLWSRAHRCRWPWDAAASNGSAMYWHRVNVVVLAATVAAYDSVSGSPGERVVAALGPAAAGELPEILSGRTPPAGADRAAARPGRRRVARRAPYRPRGRGG